MRITFLGGGNMTTALIGGLLNHGSQPASISVIEISAEKRALLEKNYGINVFDGADAAALACDAIVLAVKPQQMREACQSLQRHLRDQLVISIAAGLRLTDLSRWLGGHEKLVRTMPNTPSLISAGMTGLFAPPSVSEAERLGAERIMQAVGRTVWVNEEAQINAVTAISGSGPAYVFLFIEALQEAAAELGLSPKQARQLSIETFLGAAKLAAQSDEPASVLRERVTSKGGTTEAALSKMAEAGVKEGIVAGALAACARGAELGELLGKD
ncbi:pyrroline-5-carboxylate reductase [Propionivibrio limicola]|uniref:pyrroline-5-carboxylate reductase n=1 Tax=Propionivibrio limicola TaxID=167645 RepID=UPI0012923629|nr:pyrroline-5-carboxylate reductase [Propionivibrio limicola]